MTNVLLSPLGISLIPSIWGWRSWQRQHADVITQLQISLAIDVGANSGQWFSEFRRAGFTCPVWSFECDPRALSILESLQSDSHLSKDWKIYPFALSNVDGTADFYQWSVASGQSSTKPLSTDNPYFQTTKNEHIEQVTVETKRLDAVLTADDLKNERCLLKIDVQGAEIGVLQGAGELLSQFCAIELEVGLTEFYDGNSLIEDAIAFLRPRGFEPLTIQTERWGGGNNGPLAGSLDCDVLLVNRSLIGTTAD